MIPGGNPVIALPGNIPTLPVISLRPVLVTVEPARIANVRALRRSTRATDERGACSAFAFVSLDETVAGVTPVELHAAAGKASSNARATRSRTGNT